MENLWLTYTKEKFGYSVQKDLWRLTKGDFENFCRRIGWTTMDAEVTELAPLMKSGVTFFERGWWKEPFHGTLHTIDGD